MYSCTPHNRECHHTLRNVHHAQCADDTQLYIALSADSSISDCFLSIHRWLYASGLCLNPDKSDAIVIGTDAQQRSEKKLMTSQWLMLLFQLQEQ